jgi:MYXO-CTERM domain-containing protein
MITNVAFGSYAKRVGLDVGYEVVAVVQPGDRPSRTIPAAIALAVAAGIAGLQFARRRRMEPVRSAA